MSQKKKVTDKKKGNRINFDQNTVCSGLFVGEIEVFISARK
jgi:hypothetical protein